MLPPPGRSADPVSGDAREEIYRRNSRRDTSLRKEDIRRILFKWEVTLPSEATASISSAQRPDKS